MIGNISISQDERERAISRSRRMYQTDLQSDLATAEDRGERRGIEKRNIEIARNLREVSGIFPKAECLFEICERMRYNYKIGSKKFRKEQSKKEVKIKFVSVFSFE